jgi:hypothetical protein
MTVNDKHRQSKPQCRLLYVAHSHPVPLGLPLCNFVGNFVQPVCNFLHTLMCHQA